jgi:trehalose 6-phosphate synthase/phosphatase
MPAYRRLVIASNRLPFTVANSRGRLELPATTGGLASALSAVHQVGNNVWVGWPGDCSGLDERGGADLADTLRQRRFAPISLSGRELVEYYDGICNAVLWPVLHYQLDRLPLALPPFEAYRAVNERFAEAIVAEHQAGDIVWIHDYHLMLAPAMVRRHIPDAQIGFFLHTPFPAVDVFRVLPWRRELLEGVLGSTLVGFQTGGDAANFGAALRGLLGCAVDASGAISDGRRIDFGTYPVGIDTERLRERGRPTRRFARPDCRLFVGVDRLDYTKGIPLRLAAFERLLTANAALRGAVQLLQVAVPSREHVPAYASLKREVEALIARVNVRFGTPSWTPVRYFPESLPPADLAALYRAADVMLVTALRDGMNLVAKEYVSTREDDDGVLVLSELAGASGELNEAVMVNPYSVEELVNAMLHALDMDREERRCRMSALRRRTRAHTVHSWTDRFTSDIDAASSGCLNRPAAAAQTIRASIERAVSISLALPFEGVLVPDHGDAARSGPDPELRQLLRDLGARSGITVHVLSGLAREAMNGWFDRVPAVIWAEHGLWRRDADGHRWRQTQRTATGWHDDVCELLEQFVARTPGAFVEAGSKTLAWHFDRADTALGQSQAQTLTALLNDAADPLGYEVICRPGVVEVRAAGLSLRGTLQKIVELNQAHQVIFVGGADACGNLGDALRPSDILVDFSRETPHDPRRARQLIRELIESLATQPRPAHAASARLRIVRDYGGAGLDTIIPASASAPAAPALRSER